MFAGTPEITDIGALLDVVDGVVPEYLERHPRLQISQPIMSSWGYKGFNEVWLAFFAGASLYAPSFATTRAGGALAEKLTAAKVTWVPSLLTEIR